MTKKPKSRTDFSILDSVIKQMDDIDKKYKGDLQQPRPAQTSSEKPK